MEIKIWRDILVAWSEGADPDSRKRGREYVGDEIACAAFSLGIESSLQRSDEPNALLNNQQRIFRWSKGETSGQREKFFRLLPAIAMALPDSLAAPLLAAESMEYRALDAAERSVKKAKSAFIRSRRALFIQEHRTDRSNGPAGNSLYH